MYRLVRKRKLDSLEALRLTQMLDSMDKADENTDLDKLSARLDELEATSTRGGTSSRLYEITRQTQSAG